MNAVRLKMITLGGYGIIMVAYISEYQHFLKWVVAVIRLSLLYSLRSQEMAYFKITHALQPWKKEDAYRMHSSEVAELWWTRKEVRRTCQEVGGSQAGWSQGANRHRNQAKSSLSSKWTTIQPANSRKPQPTPGPLRRIWWALPPQDNGDTNNIQKILATTLIKTANQHSD